MAMDIQALGKHWQVMNYELSRGDMVLQQDGSYRIVLGLSEVGDDIYIHFEDSAMPEHARTYGSNFVKQK
jgi:hypothetical protein